MNSIQVPVSNAHQIETWAFEARTEQQFETVKKIVESPDFDFSSFSNLFNKDEVGNYKGSFNFIYYVKNGAMVLVKITSSGRISRRIVTNK